MIRVKKTVDYVSMLLNTIGVTYTLLFFPSRGYLGKIVYIPGLNFQTNASCTAPELADGHVPRVAFEKCVSFCSAPSAPCLDTHTQTHTHTDTHTHTRTHTVLPLQKRWADLFLSPF